MDSQDLYDLVEPPKTTEGWLALAEDATAYSRFPHPGVVIRKYLEKHNMTITELNEKAGTGHSLFHSLVRDRHRLTSQVALRLGKVFNNDPKFWLDLQTNYDLLTDSQDFKETLEDTIEVLPAALLRSEEYA